MAQSRPTTTTDGAKALAREITSLKRRVRDLELHPDPVGGAGDTYLRIYDAGHSGQADHNALSSDPDNSLVSFQNPWRIEQSGGFTFSDHPNAKSWDTATFPTLTEIDPLRTNHRIDVPKSAIYTVSLSVSINATFLDFAQHPGPITADVNTFPQGSQTFNWIWGQTRTDGQLTGGSRPRPCFSQVSTVLIEAGNPFWVEVMIFDLDAVTPLLDRTQAVSLFNVELTLETA